MLSGCEFHKIGLLHEADLSPKLGLYSFKWNKLLNILAGAKLGMTSIWDRSVTKQGDRIRAEVHSGSNLDCLKCFSTVFCFNLLRLLNICVHVIEERVPGPPQTKPSLPSLPNAPSLSPIKRKAKSLKEDASASAGITSNATEKTAVTGSSGKSASAKGQWGRGDQVMPSVSFW